MPIDMQMYWQGRDGDYENAPDPAPIWEFIDEAEIPEYMSFSDETGLVLVEG